MKFSSSNNDYVQFYNAYSRIENFNVKMENGKFYDVQCEYYKRANESIITTICAFDEFNNYIGFYSMHVREDIMNLWLFGIVNDFQGKGYGKEMYKDFLYRTKDLFVGKMSAKTNIKTKPAMHNLLLHTKDYVETSNDLIIKVGKDYWTRYYLEF